TVGALSTGMTKLQAHKSNACPIITYEESKGSFYHRQLSQGFSYGLVRVLEIGEFPIQIIVISSEVKVSMSAKVKKYAFPLAFFFANERLVDCSSDRMCALRRRYYGLCLGECQCRLENRQLRICPCLDDAVLVKLGHKRRIAVIAEASGMNARGHEIVAQGVHHQKWRQSGCIAEVIPELSLGQGRAGARLNGDGSQLFAVDLISQKGEGDSAEVGPSSAAADDDIRIF